MWAVAAAIDIITLQLALRHQRRLPPQPQHLPERFGLFVVIVVGEVVAAIVVALKGHDLGPAPMLAGALAVALGCLAAQRFSTHHKTARDQVTSSESTTETTTTEAST